MKQNNLRKFIATTICEYLNEENHLKSDAMGYNMGEFLYHITPKRNIGEIMKSGFIPKDGIAINNKPYKNRLYFATSLIAAYDLSVNFGSYKDNEEYVIFKVKSNCVNNEYEKDTLFPHGIYVDYQISNNCIVSVMNADDLFNKFDENDIENLYI